MPVREMSYITLKTNITETDELVSNKMMTRE